MPKEIEIIDIESNISARYSIQTFMNSMENARFCQEIFGVIESIPDRGKPDLVGHILGFKILAEQSCENGMSLFDTVDYEGASMDVGQHLYNFQTEDWCDEVNIFYKHDILETDLLILANIQILPKFRRCGIGRKVIKDLYNNFIGGCGLFALKCFPMQFQAGLFDTDSVIIPKMGYKKLEKDFNKAFTCLYSFYKSIGFQSIKGLPKPIMVINPALKNKKFQSIILD